jgi:hypothetical protein
MTTNERIIRLKTVLARTGLSRSTVYRKIADGTFLGRCRSARAAPAGMSRPSTNGSMTRQAGSRPVPGQSNLEVAIIRRKTSA